MLFAMGNDWSYGLNTLVTKIKKWYFLFSYPRISCNQNCISFQQRAKEQNYAASEGPSLKDKILQQAKKRNKQEVQKKGQRVKEKSSAASKVLIMQEMKKRIMHQAKTKICGEQKKLYSEQ